MPPTVRLLLLAWLTVSSLVAPSLRAQPPGAAAYREVPANAVAEFSFTARREYRDPFGEVALEAVFTEPSGQTRRVPSFWAGGQTWKLRYASPAPGRHEFRTECSAEDPGLRGQRGAVRVRPCSDGSALGRHGPVRLSDDHRHFAHADGTPFFWLADTWWFGFCGRLRDADFRALARQRAQEGFTVIKIVAGFCPDIGAFDPREANAGGHAWEQDFSRLNPAYFDGVDRRVRMLVDAGLVPSLVGMWGYYLPWIGTEKAKLHWRYLVARYGAFPVAWTLAGETTLPWYLAQGDELGRLQGEQERGWGKVRAQLVALDPWRRPLSAHPRTGVAGLESLARIGPLDFMMLQPGESDAAAFAAVQPMLRQVLEAHPNEPVMIGEACYEGQSGENGDKLQRMLFWSAILSGAAGHCYGADGLWQVNQPGNPFGASPLGNVWGDRPWTQARYLPGAKQLGLGARLLGRWRWWKFTSHPEWLNRHANEKEWRDPYAAGVPGEVRVVYFPRGLAPWRPTAVQRLEAGVEYTAAFYDPITGTGTGLGTVKPDGAGTWPVPQPPVMRDWLLVLETRCAFDGSN